LIADSSPPSPEATRYLALHPSFPADTPKELTDGFRSVRVPVLLNTALTALKVSPAVPQVAIQSATRVLDIPEITLAERAKALYRRGLAYVASKQDEGAEADLVEADKLLGGQDAALKAELEKVRTRRREKREKEKKAFRGLFA
jgi:peptidyl-prolyl isomerase D